MRVVGSALALSLLVMVGGCASPVYPGQPAYRPSAVEQPQRVNFFYGTVIDVRPVPIKFGDGGVAIGVAPRWPSPTILGANFAQGAASARGRLSLGAVDIFAEASVPDLPAVEYTVVLDKKTNPPDPYLDYTQHPAILVVQNQYPTDLPLKTGDRAFVRVVGKSGHVMRADTIPPSVERIISAGPMPIPLAYAPSPPACNPNAWDAIYTFPCPRPISDNFR